MEFAIPRPARIALAATLACLTAACGGGSDGSAASVSEATPTVLPHPDPSRPNIVLVTIDTLRRDHVSAYGYDRLTTPYLDLIAADGLRFERAYATSSWTVPSLASLLTSLYPEAHGVTAGTVGAGSIRGQQVLSDDLPRLPELLRRAGYSTFGITANGHLTGELGFAAGFDRYENLGFAADATAVSARVEAWRDEIAAAEPFFVWLHYFDPHAPYRPRRPWIDEYAPAQTKTPRERLVVNNAKIYASMGLTPGSPDFEQVVALYDAEIGYTDEAMRHALHWLDPRREALVVVTSDHGEEFGDHGSFGHRDTLYDELIRVPLIVRLPGNRFAGRTVEQPVSLIDLGPALLDAIGLDVPPTLQGRSFLPFVDGAAHDDARPILSGLERWESWSIHAVVRGDWKYLRYGGSREGAELFDLAADPGERHDLAGAAGERLAALATLLDEERAGHAQAPDPEVLAATEERLEQLRSLGYVQ